VGEGLSAIPHAVRVGRVTILRRCCRCTLARALRRLLETAGARSLPKYLVHYAMRNCSPSGWFTGSCPPQNSLPVLEQPAWSLTNNRASRVGRRCGALFAAVCSPLQPAADSRPSAAHGTLVSSHFMRRRRPANSGIPRRIGRTRRWTRPLSDYRADSDVNRVLRFGGLGGPCVWGPDRFRVLARRSRWPKNRRRSLTIGPVHLLWSRPAGNIVARGLPRPLGTGNSRDIASCIWTLPPHATLNQAACAWILALSSKAGGADAALARSRPVGIRRALVAPAGI